MTLRVLGPGLGRTGTYSLKLALERLLGGPCHHMAEVNAEPEHHLTLWAPVLRGEEVDWEDVFAGYVAQMDFPGAAFWPELREVFPDALVVLSTRPAEDWYRSAASTPPLGPPSPPIASSNGPSATAGNPSAPAWGCRYPMRSSPGPTPLRSSGPTTASADW